MMIKKIFLSIFSLLLAFSVGATLYVNVSFADDGYLFNGDTEAISATYVGTGKSSVDTKATAPEGLTGNSYAYTNYNAAVTFSYVSKTQKNTIGDGAYNAIRIIAKFDTDMQPETLQFGLFNLEEALNGEELKDSCIMDHAGVRWDKNAGNASDITVGWNVITLPLDDLNTYGGFSRGSCNISEEARTKMNAFAIRAFGGGSVFEVDIYSVELVTLSDTVKCGVTVYGKSEETKVEDVVPTVASWEDLNKSTAEIDGVTYDTYGSVGWGKFAKQIKFDKPYDVSKINATGKGAIALFFYMDNEELLARYTEAAETGSWNIDVYGSAACNDNEKLSFNIKKVFKDVVCGWNKIILPFGVADEKNNMNFETVYGIRLNTHGFEINSGNTISVAGIKFTVTDYTENTVVTDIKDVAFGLSDAGDGLTVENAEVDGHSFDVVYVNGWGGYVRVLTLDGAYDVSALKNSGRGALALRFYLKDETALNVYKGLTTYNLDVCSADSYNDNNKASFNISAAFSMCQVGWNRILIPLSAGIIDAGGSVDWSSIKNIRINNSQGGDIGTYTAFGDIQVVLSDVEELTVEGYVPPEPEPGNHREACEADSGLHIESFDEPFGDGQKETRTGFVKQGEASMRLTGLGTGGTGKKLAYAYDLSSYDKISFNLYVDDAEAFLAMADGQLEMTSLGTNDDGNEINWKLKNLKLKDGWNYVVLDMADAEKTGAVDVTKINYIRFYFVGLSKTVTTIFDDLHAHKSEGVVIEGFDGSFNGYIENVAGKVGNALNMSGDGWIERKKYAEPVDISDADKIAIWINCLDESTCKQIAGTEMEISSSGTWDKNELTFHFPNDLKVGWNHLIFDIKTATRTGGECDLTKVNFLGFIKPGLNKIGVYFDDLRAIESKFVLEEETVKIDKKIILPCDKVVDGVFDGLTVDDENAKEGVASLTTNGQNKDEILSASFNAVKTGLSLKGENELGYTFWFYVEKAENLSSLSVELSSSANCDEFELQWDLDLSKITDGWNWITLKASDAQKVGGVIDLDNIVRTRLIIFGKDGTKNLIKLDCFQIVDATLDGAFDKVETVVVLNPVTAVDANDCEQAWENGSVDETNKKEGYSSISVKGNGNATVTVKGTANVGKTDLLVANYKKSNKLGVSFWLYVASMEDVESVTFALTAGSGKISWNVTNLETGWNWVVLSVSDENATVTGNADADNITAVELTVNAAANEGTYKDFAVNIDRVKVINAAVEENYTEPADESKQRNYVKELVIIDCNSTSGTSFSGNKVDKEDFRYGNGSVYTSGAGYALNAIDLEIGKTDLTKDTFVLAFWIWIEDPALYVDGVDGQVEISSSNEYDKREINWDFVKVAKNLEKGWNWVVFKGSEAVVSDGTLPDFDNLCRFRIYVNNIAASTMKIDRITIGYIGNEKLFAAPDYENEKDNSGTFKGPNGKVAENGTYIEVDFEEAEGFTALEAEGCGSEAGAECGIVAALALVAAVVLKKRNQKAIR